MEKENNDNGMLLLATIVKKMAIVIFRLGVIGSYFLGESMGEMKYIFDTYARRVSYDFNSFATGLIMTTITSLLVYVLGEILERTVLCDANLHTLYKELNEIKDTQKRLINNEGNNKWKNIRKLY